MRCILNDGHCNNSECIRTNECKKLITGEDKMKIFGYRVLSEEDVTLINQIKKVANDLGEIVEAMRNMEDSDKRWVEIAKKDLQTGFMALIRSVAKPESF
jgi:hypothetical protein